MKKINLGEDETLKLGFDDSRHASQKRLFLPAEMFCSFERCQYKLILMMREKNDVSTILVPGGRLVTKLEMNRSKE